MHEDSMYSWPLLSALFCPAMAAVCPCKTFLESKLTAWIRLRHTALADLHKGAVKKNLHQQPLFVAVGANFFSPPPFYTIVRPRDGKCVRARTQYVAQTIVPSRSHRYDVSEFKKNSILATLGDVCLSGLRSRRVFACRVLQIPSLPRR